MKNIFYFLIIISLTACSEPKKANVLTLPVGEIPHLPKAVAANNTTTTSTPGTINPAHGEPGHTCAVAVGALIPSAPNAGTKDLTQQQPSSVVPVGPSFDPKDSSPNPKHGEPKHRCDIPVGSPLNSKPTAATVQTQQTAKVAATARGMNPPHGEKGHRCDIAVGAPLNGKALVVPPSVAKSPVAAPVVPSEPVKIEQANGGVRN